jgi:hypothetical protein
MNIQEQLDAARAAIAGIGESAKQSCANFAEALRALEELETEIEQSLDEMRDEDELDDEDEDELDDEDEDELDDEDEDELDDEDEDELDDEDEDELDDEDEDELDDEDDDWWRGHEEDDTL